MITKKTLKKRWLPVPGYVGFYEVSNFGDIRSVTRTTKRCGSTKRVLIGRPMKLNKNSPYLLVMLSKKSKTKMLPVHRLVAIAFIYNKHKKPDINHKDGDKKNNCVSNLEWVTKSENSLHACKTGLIRILKGDSCPASKLTSENISDIRKKLSLNITCLEISGEYNVHRNTISDIKFNRTWTHIK